MAPKFIISDRNLFSFMQSPTWSVISWHLVLWSWWRPPGQPCVRYERNQQYSFLSVTNKGMTWGMFSNVWNKVAGNTELVWQNSVWLRQMCFFTKYFGGNNLPSSVGITCDHLRYKNHHQASCVSCAPMHCTGCRLAVAVLSVLGRIFRPVRQINSAAKEKNSLSSLFWCHLDYIRKLFCV